MRTMMIIEDERLLGSELKRRFEREGWQATTIQDDDKSSIAAKFGLTSFPYFVAVDADGKVVARTSGEIPTEEFDALVQAARSGTPPA